MASARNVTRDTDLATSLEVARSLWAKFMGLMGRSTLPEGSGLWLPDSNGIHMMFMRFPIDAVFLGRPVAGSAGVSAGSAAAGSAVGSAAGSAGSAGSAVGSVGSAGSAAAVGSAARPVVSVHRGVRAWTGLVPFIHGAHGVLELPTGTIDATGTVRGDLIVIE